MEPRTLQDWLEVEYPVELYRIEEDDGTGVYFAFHPDFGHSACSAVGDTQEEAISELSVVRRDVIQHYYETGRTIPEPSPAPFKTDTLQQMPIRVTKQLHRRLSGLAKQSGQSLNAYITTVLTEHVTFEKALELFSDRFDQAIADRWYASVPAFFWSSTQMTTLPVSLEPDGIQIVNEEPEPRLRCVGWEE